MATESTGGVVIYTSNAPTIGFWMRAPDPRIAQVRAYLLSVLPRRSNPSR